VARTCTYGKTHEHSEGPLFGGEPGPLPPLNPALATIATKLSRLDACEDWKVVCWCRTRTSNNNSQGVVDGGVNKAGASTAAPKRSTVGYSAVKCTRAKEAVRNVVTSAPQSEPAGSGTRRVMLVSCDVTKGVGDT